jgi:hypothetical protein
MFHDSVPAVAIALVGFDRRDHMQIVSRLKASSLFREWRPNEGGRPDCVLVDEGYEGEGIDCGGADDRAAPTVTVRAAAVDAGFIARLTCGLRWTRVMAIMGGLPARDKAADDGRSAIFPPRFVGDNLWAGNAGTPLAGGRYRCIRAK